MDCGAWRGDTGSYDGWLIENRPTLGGGMIEICLCFPCRNLVPVIDYGPEYPECSDLPTGDESP